MFPPSNVCTNEPCLVYKKEKLRVIGNRNPNMMKQHPQLTAVGIWFEERGAVTLSRCGTYRHTRSLDILPDIPNPKLTDSAALSNSRVYCIGRENRGDTQAACSLIVPIFIWAHKNWIECGSPFTMTSDASARAETLRLSASLSNPFTMPSALPTHKDLPFHRPPQPSRNSTMQVPPHVPLCISSAWGKKNDNHNIPFAT